MRNQANSRTRPRVFSALYFNVRLPVIQMETNGSNPEGLLYFGDNKEATLQILHVSFHSYLFRIFNIVVSVVVVFVVFFGVSNLLFCFDGNKEAMCKSFARVSSFELPDFSQLPQIFPRIRRSFTLRFPSFDLLSHFDDDGAAAFEILRVSSHSRFPLFQISSPQNFYFLDDNEHTIISRIVRAICLFSSRSLLFPCIF